MKPRHCNDSLPQALISLGTKETIAMSEDRQLMVINHEENAGPLVMKLRFTLPQVDAHSASTGRSDLLAKVGIRVVLGALGGAVKVQLRC